MIFLMKEYKKTHQETNSNWTLPSEQSELSQNKNSSHLFWNL